MSDHAVADNARANLFRLRDIAIGIALTAAALRWLGKEPSTQKRLNYFGRRISYSLIAMLPLFAPRPYAFFGFLDETIWGALVHGLFGQGSSIDFWSPLTEIFLFIGNPGFYSGMILGYLIHTIDREILWSFMPGIFAVLGGVTAFSTLGHQTVWSSFIAIAPTVLIMFGPHAPFGFLIGGKIWRFRNNEGEFASNRKTLGATPSN